MVVSNIYYRHKPNSVINGQHEYIVCDHANHKKSIFTSSFYSFAKASCSYNDNKLHNNKRNFMHNILCKYFITV